MARVSVKSEDESGRNQVFHDNVKDRDMSRAEFVNRIQQGEYPRYHVRDVNGIATPVSNPDNSENNNLG